MLKIKFLEETKRKGNSYYDIPKVFHPFVSQNLIKNGQGSTDGIYFQFLGLIYAYAISESNLYLAYLSDKDKRRAYISFDAGFQQFKNNLTLFYMQQYLSDIS